MGGPGGPTGPSGPGGQQMGVGYGAGGSGGSNFNNPSGQYSTQPPYHSPQMQNTPGNMGVPQRFPSGPGQGPAGPQGRSIGNPKQALQDMIRARNDPQFSSAGPGSNFIPPGRTSFPMRPSMSRMPQSTMYGPSGGSNQGQYMNTGAASSGGTGNTGYMQQMQQGKYYDTLCSKKIRLNFFFHYKMLMPLVFLD